MLLAWIISWKRMDCEKFTIVPTLSPCIFTPWLISGFVTRVTQRVPLVEQELPTLPEHMSSPPVFSGVHVTRSLVLCTFVCFGDHCLYFFFWSLCCLFKYGTFLTLSLKLMQWYVTSVSRGSLYEKSEHKLCQIWNTCIVSCILLLFKIVDIILTKPTTCIKGQIY